MAKIKVSPKNSNESFLIDVPNEQLGNADYIDKTINAEVSARESLNKQKQVNAQGIKPVSGAYPKSEAYVYKDDSDRMFSKVPGMRQLENYAAPGINQAMRGAWELGLGEDKAGGASDVYRGTMRTMAPLALRNPVQAARMIVPSAIAGKGVEMGAAALGATPGQSNLAGDIAGAGVGFSPAIQSGFWGGLRGAWNAATSPSSPYKGLGIPASIGSSALGKYIGQAFGHPEAGAIIGGAAPMVKGAYAGASEAASEAPWMGVPNILKSPETPQIHNAQWTDHPAPIVPSYNTPNPWTVQPDLLETSPYAEKYARTGGAIPMSGPQSSVYPQGTAPENLSPTSPRELPPASYPENVHQMGPAMSPQYAPPNVQTQRALPAPEAYPMPSAEGMPAQKLLGAPQNFQFPKQVNPVIQPINPESVNITPKQLAETATGKPSKPVAPVKPAAKVAAKTEEKTVEKTQTKENPTEEKPKESKNPFKKVIEERSKKEPNADIQASKSSKEEESSTKSTESPFTKTHEVSLKELYKDAESTSVNPTALHRHYTSLGIDVEPFPMYGTKTKTRPVLTSEQMKRVNAHLSTKDLFAEK